MDIVPQGSAPADTVHLHGWTVKISTLLTLLLVFLVFGTAIVSSYYTITIGIKAVEETKGAGDEAVAVAFEAGSENVAYMTKEFMIKVSDDVKGQIAAHLGTSTAITEYLSGYVASYPEATVKSSAFIEGFVVQANSFARANSPRGITEYGLLFLKDGHLSYVTVLQDPLTTGNPEYGFHHFISLMTLNATHYSERTIDTHGVMSVAPCNLTSPEIGFCTWDSARIEKGGETEIIRMVYKALAAPGHIQWAPIHGVLSSVRTLSITSFTFDSGFGAPLAPAPYTSLAVVWSAVVTDGISALLKSITLPNSSRLYCLDIDHEDLEASRIAGANYGSAYVETLDPVSGDVRRYPAVAINSTDPVIRGHSRALLSTGNITSVDIVDWVDARTNRTYWEAVDVLTDKYGLRLIIVLLVPQDVVMANITRTTLEVDQQIADNYNAMGRRRYQSYKLMMILVTLVPLSLLFLSVIMAQRVMHPIELLSQHMADVSTMQLNIPEQDSFSRLEEVAIMQEAFRRMVEALKEYRSYLPQTILVSDDSDTLIERGSVDRGRSDVADVVSNGEKAKVSDAESGPSQGSEGASTPKKRSSSAQRHPFPDALIKEKLSVQLHIRKNAAFVLINTKGFTHFCLHSNVKLDAVMYFHACWLDACLAGARRHKGMVERFIADEVQVSFGASAHGVQCSVNACRYVCELRDRLEIISKEENPKTYIGMASGKVLAGTLGCATQRGPAVIGRAVHEARVMRQLAVRLNVDTVAMDNVFDEAKTHYRMVPVDIVSIYEGKPAGVCYYLMHGFPENANAEWMYTLQGYSDPTAWDAAFVKLLENSIRAVLPELQKAMKTESDEKPSDPREACLAAYKQVFMRDLQGRQASEHYTHEYVHTFM